MELVVARVYFKKMSVVIANFWGPNVKFWWFGSKGYLFVFAHCGSIFLGLLFSVLVLFLLRYTVAAQ